ncbi:MAG: ATP-dependent 6-phosphofructokinase [Holosporales bacterium]|jgi:6-phosphofructokinase 1|nr:ATP-dependent 6-phosphofructokinase [Holosporales bacterium]
MSSNKRIGIFTCGGDCSGLNSVIRAAYIRSKILGYELVGIKRGLLGLVKENPDFVILNDNLCSEDLLTASGSVIYSDTRFISTKMNDKKAIDDVKRSICDGYSTLGLAGLIYVGGDGSLSLISELFIKNSNINIIAIPKTIDNDVAMTDVSIGFYTVVEVVSNAIENIRSTAKSHERTMIIEVMGRDAGFIAMYSGIASGVDAILVPEFRYSIEGLKNKVKACYDSGRDHCLAVVAEAVEDKAFRHESEFVNGIVQYSNLKYNGAGQHIAQRLKEEGFDSRAVVLGHIQRGGKTSINDRIIASAFGAEAVNLIDSGNYGKLLIYVSGAVKAIDITDLGNKFNRKLDKSDICVNIARNLGVYIGDI